MHLNSVQTLLYSVLGEQFLRHIEYDVIVTCTRTREHFRIFTECEYLLLWRLLSYERRDIACVVAWLCLESRYVLWCCQQRTIKSDPVYDWFTNWSSLLDSLPSLNLCCSECIEVWRYLGQVSSNNLPCDESSVQAVNTSFDTNWSSWQLRSLIRT